MQQCNPKCNNVEVKVDDACMDSKKPSYLYYAQVHTQTTICSPLNSTVAIYYCCITIIDGLHSSHKH